MNTLTPEERAKVEYYRMFVGSSDCITLLISIIDRLTTPEPPAPRTDEAATDDEALSSAERLFLADVEGEPLAISVREFFSADQRRILDSLRAKGYIKLDNGYVADSTNYIITDKGRAALKAPNPFKPAPAPAPTAKAAPKLTKAQRETLRWADARERTGGMYRLVYQHLTPSHKRMMTKLEKMGLAKIDLGYVILTPAGRAALEAK